MLILGLIHMKIRGRAFSTNQRKILRGPSKQPLHTSSSSSPKRKRQKLQPECLIGHIINKLIFFFIITPERNMRFLQFRQWVVRVFLYYYCKFNYFQNRGISRISSVNCAAGITSRSNPSSPLFVLSFCGLNEWQVGLLPAFSHAQIGLSLLAVLDPGCVQETIDFEHKVNYAQKLDSLNVG